jgi:hypothetical protein
MQQLANLIKHELVDNLTSRRYILTSIVCIGLCVVSIVLVIPNFSPFLAPYLRPIPTGHEIQRNIRGLSSDIWQQGREEIENFI